MARPVRGSITEHRAKDGRTYRSLRFTAYGKRRRVPLGPMSGEAADAALRHTLADVERGTWQPSAAIEPPPEREPVQTFHEFAEEWWTRAQGQLSANTRLDYTWRLEVHLVPYFGELRLDAITFDTIERYIAGKLAGTVYDKGVKIGDAEPLSPRSINMTLTLLGAILERARKRKLIAENPARDRDLRVRERAPARSYLESAEQITALLDAGGELDRSASKGRTHVERRAMLATLTFAGLRIGELLALRWRDVDLAGGWLRVGDAKTDAGRRRVKVRGALRDELLAVRGRHQDAPQDAYVFATRTGARLGPDNFRNRVLRAAVKRADENLGKRDLAPLPAHVTPHSLRRTFASVLYALGESPPVVMQEMGHTDPAMALRIYAQAMRLDDSERAKLAALVEGEVLANSGQRAQSEPVEASESEAV